MPDKISVITCTGERPQAFKLCARYMASQKWDGEIQWIVVDDGETPTVVPATAIRVVPATRWRPGMNTLATNILAAIPQVRHDKILFVEDDDYYAPTYVATMARLLDTADLVGDPVSLYYHTPTRQSRVMKNFGCASLCQTGITRTILPILQRICTTGSNFIDGRLWGAAPNGKLLSIGQCVGIKGLPGRPGIGVGHRPEKAPSAWQSDPHLTTFREWVGKSTIKLYEEFMNAKG